jgi:uncharacterized protein (TIGR02246 family)
LPFNHAATLLCIGAVLLPACEIARTPLPQAMDPDSLARSEIRAVMDDYHDAVLAGDARRAASFFTSESRFYLHGEPDYVGGREIFNAFRSSFEESQLTSLTFDRRALDVARGGVAWEHGTFVETYRSGLEAERTVRGRYMVRWRRGAEAKWRMDTYMVNYLE